MSLMVQSLLIPIASRCTRRSEELTEGPEDLESYPCSHAAMQPCKLVRCQVSVCSTSVCVMACLPTPLTRP